MSTESNPDIELADIKEELTKRVTIPGAEKWLGVYTPVLDHGFISLVDYMGGDEAIESAARVSYGRGTRKVSETTGLIRYLRRHHHTTPFEMVELKFHAKMPILVARQWIRHRTANVNEYSARYSIIKDEFYIPEPSVVSTQSSSNRQGRGETVPELSAEEFRNLLTQGSETAYKQYEYYLNDNGKGSPEDEDRPMIARELARAGLPVNFYTEWYWKCDLHNIFHFLRLRMDPHAQWEIRQYADAMANVVADVVPIAYKAFEDYELNATQLSRPEKDVLTTIIKRNGLWLTLDELNQLLDTTGLTNKREREELVAKFKDLGIIQI